MQKIKVKIVKNSFSDTCWYANQIGSTFNVKVSEKHKDEYMLDENMVDSVMTILKSDCEVIDEPAMHPEPFDLERAIKGEKFTWKEKPGTYCIIGKSPNGYQSDHGCKYVVEQVDWKGDIYLWRWTADELSKFIMAPKEPEYLEGWVVVTPSGIIGTVFFTRISALKSVGGNTWKIEKIRFPKP